MTMPMVTVIIEIIPDGEVRFGPAPMRLTADGSWQIPALIWDADATVTIKDCRAEIMLPNDPPQNVRIPNSFRGQRVDRGNTVRVEFENAKFYFQTKAH